jgi:hypothetical protein
MLYIINGLAQKTVSVKCPNTRMFMKNRHLNETGGNGPCAILLILSRLENSRRQKLRTKRWPISGRAHEVTDGQGLRWQRGRPRHSQLAENKLSRVLLPAASFPSPAMLLEHKGLFDIHLLVVAARPYFT